MPHSPRFLIVGALALVLLPACAGSKKTTDEEEENLPAAQVDLARYEDFDPAPYREEAPATSEEIDHDVPGSLMSGRADAGVEQTMQGFRIQIFSAKDKAAADGQLSSVNQWWDAHAADAPSDLFSGDLPVYVVYRQPYYRVRVGNFTSHEKAERALQYLQKRYGDAFIARDKVTVTR